MRLSLTLLCLIWPQVALAEEWSFEDAPLGQLPAGWVAAHAGEGQGSVWQVIGYEVGAKAARALAQTSKSGPTQFYNLCVLKDTSYSDIDLSVQVKAVAGEVDQGGGLVWGYKDNNNYYITRWNPLEDNFRVYHVLGGKRTQLGTVKVTPPVDQWQTVRAVHTGNRIQCYLNGALLLDVKDETIKEPGAIGLWSKADAVTWFDNLTLKPPAKE